MGGMEERTQALRAIPLFASLDEGDLTEIADLLIDRKFPKGSVIFEDGSSGDYMYVIRSGEVKITKMSEDGREKILEILGEGEFFGEMALLDREPRSASVKTTRPVHPARAVPPGLHRPAAPQPRHRARADPRADAAHPRDRRADPRAALRARGGPHPPPAAAPGHRSDRGPLRPARDPAHHPPAARRPGRHQPRDRDGG